MKKIYIAPTMKVVPMKMRQIICASIQSNVEFKYGGETDDDFNEDKMR
jgi:hypothetical protein